MAGGSLRHRHLLHLILRPLAEPQGSPDQHSSEPVLCGRSRPQGKSWAAASGENAAPHSHTYGAGDVGQNKRRATRPKGQTLPPRSGSHAAEHPGVPVAHRLLGKGWWLLKGHPLNETGTQAGTPCQQELLERRLHRQDAGSSGGASPSTTLTFPTRDPCPVACALQGWP